MPFKLGIILIAVLVFVFYKVRAGAIVQIEKVVKAVKRREPPRVISRSVEVEAWMKIHTRDVRPARGCDHIDDAPNYTSFNTEATGKFKIPIGGTGTFKIPTDGTGKFKIPQ